MHHNLDWREEMVFLYLVACSDGVACIWTVHQDMTVESHEFEAYAFLLSQYKGSRYLPLFLIDILLSLCAFVFITNCAATNGHRHGHSHGAFQLNYLFHYSKFKYFFL